MPKISGDGGQGNQGAVLTLRTLEALAHAKGEMGVTELAGKLGTTKTRVHRQLRTLLKTLSAVILAFSAPITRISSTSLGFEI